MATLTEARAQLAKWEAASLALADNRSYTIGDRQLTRANADEVVRMLRHWKGEVKELEAARPGRRVRQVAVR